MCACGGYEIFIRKNSLEFRIWSSFLKIYLYFNFWSQGFTVYLCLAWDSLGLNWEIWLPLPSEVLD